MKSEKIPPAYFDEHPTKFWLEKLGFITQADAQAGLTWWKALREEDRKFWFSAGLAATPADAWTYYKTATAKAPTDGALLPEISQKPDAPQA